MDEVRRLEEMAEAAAALGDKQALHDGAEALRRMGVPPGEYTGYCPNCRERVTMTARYCRRCGQRLPEHKWDE